MTLSFQVSIEYLNSSQTWRPSTRQFKRKLFGKDRPGIIASHHVKEWRFSETFIVWLQSIRPDACTLPHAVWIDSTALVVLAQSSSGPGLAGQSTRHLYFWISLVPDEYEMNSLVLVPLPNAGGEASTLVQIACLVNTALHVSMTSK
jgi:hypothetical protein